VANTKTAKKQLLVMRRNRARNVHFKSMLKNALKRARSVIAKADDASAAQEALSHAVRTLYRCATKGVIKRQNALRRVSRIMRMYDKSFRPKPVQANPQA
jgi:small subunit ribosomal protein S20